MMDEVKSKLSIIKAVYHFKLNKYTRLLFGEKSDIDLGFNWSNKPRRSNLINSLIKNYNYRFYLEIGCADNKCFNKIDCAYKVGVDPARGGTIRKTSDDFFSTNTDKFDCIFIDGLHEYAQVRKDILNSVEHLNENGVILLHDCLPSTINAHAVPREQGLWNGDVWRAIVEARTYADIDTCVCLIDQGVGIIKKRQNTDILKFDDSVDFFTLKFADYAANHVKWLRTTEIEKIFQFIKD